MLVFISWLILWENLCIMQLTWHWQIVYTDFVSHTIRSHECIQYVKQILRFHTRGKSVRKDTYCLPILIANRKLIPFRCSTTGTVFLLEAFYEKSCRVSKHLILIYTDTQTLFWQHDRTLNHTCCILKI